MRHPELLALICAGCTQVFDLSPTILIDAAPPYLDAPLPPPADRDRDKIPDPDDPCIASIADPGADFEGNADGNVFSGNAIDGIVGDTCPFDYQGETDPDMDVLPDDCDPFPASGGDRLRCMMSFQNPTITRALWIPRAMEAVTWDFLSSAAIVGHGTGTVIAGERIEAPAPLSTTYEAYVDLSIRAPASEAAAVLWIRTNPIAASTDVGCEVRFDGSTKQLILRGAPTPTSIVLGSASTSWTVLASFAPSVSGRANVRCSVRSLFVPGPATEEVTATIALPAGTAGFGVESADARLGGLRILERDDLPAL